MDLSNPKLRASAIQEVLEMAAGKIDRLLEYGVSKGTVIGKFQQGNRAEEFTISPKGYVEFSSVSDRSDSWLLGWYFADSGIPDDLRRFDSDVLIQAATQVDKESAGIPEPRRDAKSKTLKCNVGNRQCGGRCLPQGMKCRFDEFTPEQQKRIQEIVAEVVKQMQSGKPGEVTGKTVATTPHKSTSFMGRLNKIKEKATQIASNIKTGVVSNVEKAKEKITSTKEQVGNKVNSFKEKVRKTKEIWS